MALNVITPAQAAELFNDGEIVGWSGFTPAGACKEIPKALGERARAINQSGGSFKIGVITGASTGDSLDGSLARAEAVAFRTPYQSNGDLRKSINCGDTNYFDQHLSHVPQNIRYGFYGKVNKAVIEAADITENGEILPTTSLGITPTIAELADEILVEVNSYHSKSLRGMHDIFQPADPPNRREIPIYSPSDRIGSEILKVDPKKIVAVVESNRADEISPFAESDAVTDQIGANVAEFLAGELKRGGIPASFLPLQSGVGNIANAVLGALGANSGIPEFEMYTEVIQDSVIALMKTGKVKFASGCSLTVSPDVLNEIYSAPEFFKNKLLLRPQEITNHPEVARRLGIIAVNTALEVDLYGNVNSTHVLGSKMMNGIGGSGDFARNAYLSIFTCPATAKGGKISAFVPMVSHLDHSEHSVSIIVTENGVADLRGKSPCGRMHAIIDNCVHPDYKEILRDYVRTAGCAHTPHNLAKAFAMHVQFANSGDMRVTKFE